jgi:enoyl-CoA hydratase/carnithine racemase
VAFGGGLEIALCCDIRLAAEHAVVGLPEVHLGILPGAGGTQRLSRLCGLAVAKEMILAGRRLTADRAFEIRLLSAVVPAAELAAEAEKWAVGIASAGPLAVASAKRAIDEGFGLPIADALAVERACYEVVLSSEDRDEGLAAFAEKRKPSFKGK